LEHKMATLENVAGTANVEVDATLKALRTSIRPMEVLAWIPVAARSGAVTGLAANTALFSFRNLSANPVIVRRAGVGFITTTGFTAAQELAFGLKVARAFTVADSGGTPIALTGNNCKARSSLGNLTSVDARISTTGALTAGTKTLDANDIGITGAYALAAGVGAILPPSLNNLLSHDTGDYPIVLAQNEGINIMNLVAMGAGGVGTFYANLEMAEALAY
jgi:hypothetical protein